MAWLLNYDFFKQGNAIVCHSEEEKLQAIQMIHAAGLQYYSSYGTEASARKWEAFPVIAMNDFGVCSGYAPNVPIRCKKVDFADMLDEAPVLTLNLDAFLN